MGAAGGSADCALGVAENEEEMMEIVKSTDPYRCCWHCRYYIRPKKEWMIDGPVSSICTIDRKKIIYPLVYFPSPGDVERDPDEFCNRFEMDQPAHKL